MNRVLISTYLRLVCVLFLTAMLIGTAAPRLGEFSGPTAARAQDDDGGNGTGGNGTGGNGTGGSATGGNATGGNATGGNATGGEAPVIQTAPLSVDVTCERDQEANRSTCEFLAVGGEVTVVDLAVPAQGVCESVIGGDYEIDARDTDDDADPEFYSARDGETGVILLFRGEVTMTGTTTYWVQTAGARLPASGPGLACTVTAETPGGGDTTVPATSDTTGAIVVQAYVCDEASPDDPATYDWYGACRDAGSDLAFEIFEPEGETSLRDERSDADGEAIFGALEPGSYRLEEAGGDWCHAESDSVDERGEVVVEAGQEATVWIFQCTDDDAEVVK